MIRTYQTVDELLAEDIVSVTEDDSNYYVILAIRPDEIYHDEVWVVSKNTKKVSYMGAIPYMLDLEDEEKVKPVDVSTFRKGLI